MTKVDKKIGLIPKFQRPLSGSSLVAIYKAFIKHHLDYGDSFGGAFRILSTSKQKQLNIVFYALAVIGTIGKIKI